MGEQDCMACEEWEEHHYWKHVDAKGKLFFRVVMDDFSQSLKIPKKFINLMRDELSEIVNLKDPSGIIWHVKLNKTADYASFQSGWKDFAEAHHLVENDLLLFEYDGNSCFKIKILEGSGCEKAHSFCLKIKNSLKRGKSEDSEEDLDLTPRHKVNASCSSGSSHEDILDGHQILTLARLGQNVEKKNSNCYELPVHVKNTRRNTSKRVDTSKAVRYHIKQESDSSHEDEKEYICITRKGSPTAEEKKRIRRLAREVCSGKPYFVSVMRPTNIRSCLTVPVDFKVYLPSQSCEIILQVPGVKKKWCVRYATDEAISRFSACWKYFVNDNGLLEGDICLFELVNKHSDNIEMRVRISRVT